MLYILQQTTKVSRPRPLRFQELSPSSVESDNEPEEAIAAHWEQSATVCIYSVFEMALPFLLSDKLLRSFGVCHPSIINWSVNIRSLAFSQGVLISTKFHKEYSHFIYIGVFNLILNN